MASNPYSKMFDVEVVGGDQRTRLAEMLRANALNAPQGQMVSGWYVPPSWTQNLAHLAQTATGVFGGIAAEDAEREAEQRDFEKLRTRQLGQAVKNYGQPTPTDQEAATRTPQMTPMAGTMQNGEWKAVKTGGIPEMSTPNYTQTPQPQPQPQPFDITDPRQFESRMGRNFARQNMMQQFATPEYGTTPVDTGNGLALVSKTGQIKMLTDAQGNPLRKATDYNDLVITGPDGKPVLNPLALQAKSLVAQQGAPRQMVSVNTQLPFKEQVQKGMGEALVKNFETLQNIPSTVRMLDRASELAPKSFTGSMAENKLEAVKFLNNNLGFNISPEKVANTEELRSALFTNVMDNLKKMDASPSQQQQQVMQDAFGKIGTDPKAIPRIANVFKEILTSKAKEHNRRVEESMQGPNGMVYPYSIKVNLPENNPVKSGGKVKFLGYE